MRRKHCVLPPAIRGDALVLPRTKIVATLGPACWEEAILRDLLAAGVSVIRINFSHAEHAITAEKIALLRRLAAEEPGRNLAILADLQGPRIRVGELPPSGVTLQRGSTVTLSVHGESGAIPVDYAGLPGDVAPGDTILLDDGLLVLQVTAADPALGRIRCQVLVGGVLTSHKGINVPARPLSVPTVTEKDRVDLRFALDQGVDLIALSFVRSGADVQEARQLIRGQTARHVPIIAKIEKDAALTDFAAILAAADGVMVARGDLGVEMAPELLPGIQKRLIAAANQAAKPVITATQMLDSMIRNPRPTRAEATDVANAVLDGSDAIMLSGETAAGKYPREAVRMMARIALEAEKLFDYEGWMGHGSPPPDTAARPAGRMVPPDPHRIAELVAAAADRIAEELGAAAVITLTRSGTSARLVAKCRPRGALLAVTDDPTTQRALAVTWGVEALLLDSFGDTTLATLAAAERLAVERGLLAPGDLVVFIGDLPGVRPGQTSLLKVHVVGDRLAL
jgi:pyruvate kinase